MSNHDPSRPYRRQLQRTQKSHLRAAVTQLRNPPAGADLVDILLDQARALLARTDLPGSERAAVVLAHTASEIAAEQLGDRLVHAGKANADIKKWLKERAPRPNPLHKAVQTMLHKWGDLARYVASTGRRNGIVHRGEDVTHADAAESVELAAQAIGQFRQR